MGDDILHERELRELWQQTHEARHTAEIDALVLAREDVNRRLDGMNELREQINRERGQFLSRDLYDREHARLSEEMDRRLKVLENRESNLQGRIFATGAIIAFLLSILALALRLWKPA